MPPFSFHLASRLISVAVDLPTPKTLALNLTARRKVGEKRTPKTPSSEMRKHSPYCEATGPIVEEGFVASRVRVLQAKLEDRGQSDGDSRSCPISPWAQMFDPYKSNTTRSIIGSRRGAHVAESKSNQPSQTTLQSHVEDSEKPPKPEVVHEAAPLGNHVNAQETTVSSFNDRMEGDGWGTRADHSNNTEMTEKEILSPRAVPPQLASHIGDHDAKSPRSTSAAIRALHPRRSVADRLGSMVEREWVGCDVSDEPSKNEEEIKVPSGAFYIREKTAYSYRSTPDAFPLTDLGDENSAGPPPQSGIEDGRSQEHYMLDYDDGNPPPLYYPGPRKSRIRRAKDIEANPTATQRSAPTGRNVSEKVHRVRRATLHDYDRSSSGDSQHIKLRPLSSWHGREYHCKKQSSWERQTTELDKPIRDTSSHAKEDRPSSLVTSRAPSSRKSSVSTSHSRASSFFNNLWGGRWLKVVLVDKKPMLQDLRRRSSAPVMNGDQTHQESAVSNDSIATQTEKTYTLFECGPNNATKSADDVALQEHPEHPEHPEPHTNRPDNPGTQRQYSGSSKQSLPLNLELSAPGPGRANAKHVMEAQTPSVKNKEAPHDSISLNTHDGASAAQDGHTHFESGPSQSQTATPSIAHVTRTPERKASELAHHAPLREQMPSRSPRVEAQAESASKSVPRARRTCSAGIKRIQVIVSLDGADDLVVEARLRKKGSWQH